MYERCEAPGCTARAKRRGETDGRAAAELDLRDRLCLCKFHYEAVAEGLCACWGEPPLGVVWRLGRDELATYWQNGRRLRREDVAHLEPKTAS